jgi:hypothetical protein
MNVYLYRHQAGGVIADVVFLKPPTEAQLVPLRMRMALAYGTTHRKTGESFWDRVVEVQTLGPDDLPARPAPQQGGNTGSAAAPEIRVSGTGTVTNPKA